ncbi:MAG: HlyC/CorC family transporter [Deltaproteobacteria bacterium]|nr:HlyC/CorC family transporter [Deltaproteobacteria bacterium]
MNSGATYSLIILFLFLQGLFSGGELAFVASDINKIRSRAKSGSRAAQIALSLLERPEWFLSTTLTGTNICVVTNTALATSMFIAMFGTAIGELVSIIVMIPLLLIMGELVPKSIFRQNPEAVAIRISWFLWSASFILYPIVFIVSRISKGALNVFSQEQKPYYAPYITKTGLEFLLQKRGEKSDIMTSEREMIHRIFDFTELTAEDVMVPLSNVTVLSSETAVRDAVRTVTDRGHSRIPVYRDQVYNIIGILQSFDLLDICHGRARRFASLTENSSVADCLRENIIYVPETKPTDELLLELQKRGDHMAVIVDEYGGAVGIVTIEDIMEEIVGEIDDEYVDSESSFRKLAPGRYLFNAQAKIEHVQAVLRDRLPDGDYETLGGFLLFHMGKIPGRNEIYKYNNNLFIIEDADMKSIKEVLVVVPPGGDKAK